MQALLRAYHASDEDVPPGVLRTGALKADVFAAFLAKLKEPGSKLLRFDPNEFK